MDIQPKLETATKEILLSGYYEGIIHSVHFCVTESIKQDMRFEDLEPTEAALSILLFMLPNFLTINNVLHHKDCKLILSSKTPKLSISTFPLGEDKEDVTGN